MDIIDNKVWGWDIETLFNCFTYTAINRDTKEKVQYVIWKKRNDLRPLLEHISGLIGMIGFNNLNFDYPVIHSIILNRDYLLAQDGDFVAKWIYKVAQDVISKEYSAIKDEDVIRPQLDLFRIWHYDNKARMTSLKKLQIAMNSDNVMDMPIHHTEEITLDSQIEQILSYNLHDVEKTMDFYELTRDKIELRRGLLKQYGLKCLNFSDSKIGESLMLKLYCEALQKDENDIRKLRTRRRNFKFKNCIPNYINYQTAEFNSLLDYLKGIEVNTLKESFKYSFDFKGFTFDLGTGGIHGCIKQGVYDSDDDYCIVDADVSSLYPSLAITLGIYPKHLGEEFLDLYENGIVKPRLEAKKNGDKVMADGYKLSANAVYGKSNSEYSFLYDPLYTIKTTLAGQLGLCMLSEMLITKIPDLTMLQINTDGLTVRMHKNYRKLYWDICKEWENITKLQLEYVSYSKMIIRDVNNYIAVYAKDGKVKRKGTFKLNSEMRKDGEYHKSFSQGIVPIALSDFYLKGIPVEETVKNCEDVFEFTKMANSVGKWWTETFEINENNEEVNIISQQKNNRYLLTKNGVRFRKCTYKPNKETGVEEITKTEYEADKLVTILNNYTKQSVEELNIDHNYYIDECYKIIHLLDGTTERLDNEKKEIRMKEKLEREETNFLKFCVNKIPTQRQWGLYKKQWLIDKYIGLNQHENFYTFIELEEYEEQMDISKS